MELYEDNDNAIRSANMNSILTNTFFRMFLGLLLSAVTAFYVYQSELYVSIALSGHFITLAIIELIVVLIFSFLFKKLSPTLVTVLFFAYAFLNGLTLSVIFAVYEISSIAYAFLGTSALFGILSYVGYKTEKDISSWGIILSIALFIGIILTIINLFIGSTLMDIALDWIILFIFFGLTIYDMNKIKNLQRSGICEDKKLYIYCAMQLYLDFINIFLKILSIFGKRRN